MFLLILDKNPYKAGDLVPDKIKFKQLLELSQLICSAGISNVFKPIRQGKELQEWVSNYSQWTSRYFETLFKWVVLNVNIKTATKTKFQKIYRDLCGYNHDIKIPDTVIFRYIKDYESEYKSNSKLSIDIAIEEYKKYVKWKGYKR